MKPRYASSDVMDQLLSFRANPGKVQQYMLRLLEKMNNDEIIIMDATNPAVFCLESATIMACAGMIDSESKLRRLYPSMANTPEELYLHMADADYVNIYSSPAVVNLTLMFDLEEIIQTAVPISSATGVRKITIPRYTKVLVAEIPLTLLYPIDIKIMPHGGYNITFDTSESSPLATVDTNLLDWFVEEIEGVRYLNIVTPFHQLNVTRDYASVNAMTGFSREYSFKDLYNYVRAYIQNENGQWVEISTTMTELVYDKDKPTLFIAVLNNSIRVTIPQIYLNNGLIKDSVRIDIYTTKGPLNINLQNYTPRSYIHDWAPLDNTLNDRYSAPLQTIATVGIYSSDNIYGGNKGVTFSELKKMVTQRSATTEGLPINEKQLTRSVANLGYKIVKDIDNITDRQYLATKALPAPSNGFVVTNMGLNISSLETSFLKLKELDTVTTSTYRLTIKPQTLYKLEEGILQTIPSATTRSLIEMQRTKPALLVEQLNSDTLLYSPYYYVFDVKSTEILPRIYDMDSPVIHSRYFFQDNPSMNMRLGVTNYTIVNAPDKQGYILEIRLAAGEVAKALGPDHINVQLSYIGRDEPTRYYIDGSLVVDINPQTGKPYNDDYIYQFKIETQYDIDANDGLIPIPYRSPVNLTHEFDVVTSIRDYLPEEGYVKSDIDNILAPHYFHNYNENSQYIGVSQSKVVLKFGDRLNKLWTKTRTVVDNRQIQRYIEDVPSVYKTDIYQRDSNGNIEISYDPETNRVTTKKLHKRGDLMYDDTGEQLFDHRKGDIVLGTDNLPIYKDGSDGLKRQIDLFLIDAVYYFANTNNVTEYKNHCTRLITSWVNRDMDLISAQLLDRSEVFYYPPVSIGNVKIIADNDIEIKVESKQSIKVKAYMSLINFRNSSLKDALHKSIAEIIQACLEKKTVSLDGIHQKLRAGIGDNIISFEVNGFLKDQYRTATVKDDTMTLALGKKAVVLPNLSIDIVDDIEVEFLPHGED